MAANPAQQKRGPSVLVTDSRERQAPPRGALQRTNTGIAGAPNRPRTTIISVDNVLRYASEIPSGQKRGPPGRAPAPIQRRNAGSGPAGLASRIAQQNVPGRSTKVSEKLVLIPDTVSEKEEDSDEEDEGTTGLASKYRDSGDERPLRDDEMDILKKRGGVRGKSYAERLPKAKRAEKLARVTAYCTAQAFKMESTAGFVRARHGAKTKRYDDCLYTVYHLPLLPGTEGYRIRSSPVLKNPGGKAVLDEEIELNEQRDYHEGYFEDPEEYSIRAESPRDSSEDDQQQKESIEARLLQQRQERILESKHVAPDATTFAEMFVFSYGVVVFWNFTLSQERDILADLTFSSISTGISLTSRPQDEADFETEELHFEYNSDIERPRIFNDMITLRSGDHMIKLAMSHAIAQSTKLSFFEERMNETMGNAKEVPKRLALTGDLGMERKEIVKILGRLFKSRVDVNLSSNILDVPNFFWDAEPTLHPLYFAIREYLEITPRIKVLNERCRVFLDLAEILSDSIADSKMSTITWIIIILIVISIAVTITEVGLRFAILSREKAGMGNVAPDLGNETQLVEMCSRVGMAFIGNGLSMELR